MPYRFSLAWLPAHDANEQCWARSFLLKRCLLDNSILGRCRLAWYRQNRHDLDGFPGKDRKMRMPFEQLGRSLMRIRANHHVGAHLITFIFDAPLGDFFGLAERSTHADDYGLMFFGPCLPSRYPLLLLRKPFRFGKGIPCCHSRVRLAAEKHREKCIVRAHEISFPLYALRAQTKARYSGADAQRW